MKRNFYFPTIFDELDALCTALPSGCCESNKPKGLFVSEDQEHLYIDAQLPGVDPKDVEVTLNPQEKTLTISGKGTIKRDNVNWHQKGSTSFRYEIPLSNEINLDTKVEAVSRHGVLSVTLTKNKGHKPLKIDVHVA